MTTTPPVPQLSPTGRLNTTEPEQQYFPGSPQALAQRRRMTAALAAGTALPFFDFSMDKDFQAK